MADTWIVDMRHYLDEAGAESAGRGDGIMDIEMDEAAYRDWWPLHLRVARGETLTPAEEASYNAGLRQLHQADPPLQDIERLRKARADLPALETEHTDLVERRQRLDAEIAALEAALNERTRAVLTAQR